MAFTYRVLLKPKDIWFKKKLLASSFDNGIPLRETLQQLVNDEILIEDVPTIDVVWCKEKWAWYTLDHRRLWVFRELEKLGKCQYIATKRIETIEHVNDNFLLYGSAELIGESPTVSWDSEDGLKITVYDKDTKSAKFANKCTRSSPKGDVRDEQGSDRDRQRAWRERTPLTVKITWDKPQGIEKSENGTKSSTTENVKRERKDSGFSETCSEIKVVKSRACEDNAESVIDCESGEDENKSCIKRRCRFNKFQRYRPYSRPECSDSSSEDKEKVLTRRRAQKNSLRNVTGRQVRKRVHDRSLFILHHGDRPRIEQQALKTMLMNTCGLCYKSFKARVSLSQHVEELRHWACIRCGKYFNSYTALGQHILAVDHCNV